MNSDINKIKDLEWHWPFRIQDTNLLPTVMKKSFGINPNISYNKQLEFFNELRSSLSLSYSEKLHVILNYKILSVWQIDELIKTFNEEKEKFIALNEKHTKDIRTYIIVSELEWSILLNKNNGIFYFFENYLYSNVLSKEELQRSFYKLDRALILNDFNLEVVLLNEYLITNNILLDKKNRMIYRSINSYLNAYIQTNNNVTIKELENNFIIKKINDFTEGSKAFLDLLLPSYLIEKQGTSKFSKNKFKLFLLNYYKSKTPADISGVIGYYYLCNGNFKTGLKAIKRSVSKNINRKKYKSIKFGKITKHFNRDVMKKNSYSFNIQRNFFNLCVTFALELNQKHSFNQIEKSIPKIIKHLEKWYPSDIYNEFNRYAYFIAISGDIERIKAFVKNKSIVFYIQKIANPSNIYIYEMLNKKQFLSNPLDGLMKALVYINNKKEMLYYLFSIRHILSKDLINRFEIITLDTNLKIIYKEALKTTGISYNKELEFIK